MLAAVRVHPLDLTCVQIDNLDAAARVILALQRRAVGAAFLDPREPAVVADEHPASGPQCSPIGSSGNIGDHLDAAIWRDTGKCLSRDLDEDDRSVRHGCAGTDCKLQSHSTSVSEILPTMH